MYDLLRLILLFLITLITHARSAVLLANTKTNEPQNPPLNPITPKPQEYILASGDSENPLFPTIQLVEPDGTLITPDEQQAQAHNFLIEISKSVLEALDKEITKERTLHILLASKAFEIPIMNTFLTYPEAFQHKHISALIEAGYLEQFLLNFRGDNKIPKRITLFEYYLRSLNLNMANHMLELGQKPNITPDLKVKVRYDFNYDSYYEIQVPLIYLPLYNKEDFKNEASYPLVMRYLHALTQFGYTHTEKNIALTNKKGITTNYSMKEFIKIRFPNSGLPALAPSSATTTTKINSNWVIHSVLSLLGFLGGLALRQYRQPQAQNVEQIKTEKAPKPPHKKRVATTPAKQSPVVTLAELPTLTEQFEAHKKQHQVNQNQARFHKDQLDQLQIEINFLKKRALKNDGLRTLLSEKTKSLKNIISEIEDFIKTNKIKMLQQNTTTKDLIEKIETITKQLYSSDLILSQLEQSSQHEKLVALLHQLEINLQHFAPGTVLQQKDTDNYFSKIAILKERIKHYDNQQENREKIRFEAEKAQKEYEKDMQELQEAIRAEAERVAQQERALREKAEEVRRLLAQSQKTQKQTAAVNNTLVKHGFFDHQQIHQGNVTLLDGVLKRIEDQIYPFTTPENTTLVGRLALLFNLICLFEMSLKDMGEKNQQFLNKIRNIIMHRHDQLDYKSVESFTRQIGNHLYPLLKSIACKDALPLSLEDKLHHVFLQLNKHTLAHSVGIQRSLQDNINVIEQSLIDLGQLPINEDHMNAELPYDLLHAELFLISIIGESMQKIIVLANPEQNPDEITQPTKAILKKIRKDPKLQEFLDICYDVRKNIAHHINPQDYTPLITDREIVPDLLLKQFHKDSHDLQHSFHNLTQEPQPSLSFN